MRLVKMLVIAAMLIAMGSAAYAELQNVLVGGQIRIRGNYYDFDDSLVLPDDAWVEQRTRLNVRADFTDEVSAVIEIDSYDTWGEDFRSANYITGLDGRALSVDDVEIYQGYIEANEMWGTPLYMRVGRQELQLGSEWLIGNNDTTAFFTGLSFDALQVGYRTDMVSIAAIAAKLNESFSDFGEDDLDLYIVYGSYLGFEDIVLDAYWMFVRDDAALTAAEVDLHTIGLRGAGVYGAFDFEAEVAYQFGEVDLDLPWWAWWLDEPDISAFGVNAEVGYTFDMNWKPRIFLGGAWLEGGDLDGDDMPFNRLFSDWEYSEFLDNGEISNVWVARAGVSAMPTEAITVSLLATYFWADETAEGGWWFWKWEADDELGLELGLYGDYQYSEDLVFRAGYAHFFSEDGIEEGNLVAANGLLPFVDDEDHDYDYVFVETEISF